MKGDDDLTEDGNVIDLGGPGVSANIFSETSSGSNAGGDNSYGCFVGALF